MPGVNEPDGSGPDTGSADAGSDASGADAGSDASGADAASDAGTGVEGAGASAREAAATRADVLGALAIMALTAAVVLGPRLVARLCAHPSAEECDALLARYVELKERAITDKLDAKRYAAALDEARGRAGPSFDGCTTELTLEEADCTRRAGNADEFERCLR